LFSVAAPANPFRNFGISEFQLFSIFLNAYVKERARLASAKHAKFTPPLLAFSF